MHLEIEKEIIMTLGENYEYDNEYNYDYNYMYIYNYKYNTDQQHTNIINRQHQQTIHQ